jgi:hypothetical protein
MTIGSGDSGVICAQALPYRPQTILWQGDSLPVESSAVAPPTDPQAEPGGFRMNAVDDFDATIKGWRTVSWTLALGSLVVVDSAQLAAVGTASRHHDALAQLRDGAEPGGDRRLCGWQLRNDHDRGVGTPAARHPALRDCAVPPWGRRGRSWPGDDLRRRPAVRDVPNGVPESQRLDVVASAGAVRAARVE